MIPSIIALIYREIEGKKDDLSNGLVSVEDYRYIVGMIKGLREAIDLIKEGEKKFTDDEIGSDGWSEMEGPSRM